MAMAAVREEATPKSLVTPPRPILAKELRTEFRSRELLVTTVGLRADRSRAIRLHVRPNHQRVAPFWTRLLWLRSCSPAP